jgi:hypothetical protein
MKNKNFRVSFVVLVFVLFFAAHSRVIFSQDIVPPDGFLIRNASEKSITFFLRKGIESWTKFSLGSYDNEIFKNFDEIYVPTVGNGEVQYKLEFKQRYRIYWNVDKWDVAKMNYR